MEITLKLKVKDVEIELSKEDAIKLKEALEELTGAKVVKEYIPYPAWPSYPWRYWHWDPGYPVICSSGSKWTSGNVTSGYVAISNDAKLLASVS